MKLNNCAILLDKNAPTYVRHVATEMATSVKACTGQDVPVSDSPTGAEIQIVIGAAYARQLAPQLWEAQADSLGEEGYLLHALADNARSYLLVAGATPLGDKCGLLHLMRLFEPAGQSVAIPDALSLTSVPSFPVRGIHLNGWANSYPYSFRNWREEDWCRYIDLLACQGVNLLFIWPFMEIMPVPLSSEDEAYLQEVRRVVDYAHTKQGMEVWIFQSPNRIAVGDCGVRDPRQRPYWVLQPCGDFPAAQQVDMNPADPEQFARIMQSREALYRIVNNADGYCTLDSDPGGWPDSPMSEYIRIFTASRALLDRVTVQGPRTKLINWMWNVWGLDSWPDSSIPYEVRHRMLLEMISAMKSQLPEPWMLIAGRKDYLPACQEAGVLQKTVLLPYNAIEYEPSRPETRTNFTAIRDALEAVGQFPGLGGVMGNVQSPLLQFPLVSYTLATAWDYAARHRSPAMVYQELARLVYPDQRELLADGWTALEETNRGNIATIADEMATLAAGNDSPRLGALGQYLFPDGRQIARDLVFQFQMHTALRNFQQGLPVTVTPDECARLLESFLDSLLQWDSQHGWSTYWKKMGSVWPLLPEANAAWPVALIAIRQCLGDDANDENAIAAFLSPIGRRLAEKYHPWLVENCAIIPLRKAITGAPQ